MPKQQTEPLQTLKNLCDTACTFYIPAYQRGYRWGKREVEAFLTDIWEFGNSRFTPAVQEDSLSVNSFYFLQPLTLKETSVIDGQQRLTTIYLLMKCLNQKVNFRLEYENRPTLNAVLQNPATENNETPDNYCVTQAYASMQQWLEKEIKTTEEKQHFTDTLLHYTQFIWYQDDEADERESFNNLNRKIPLTSAELLKGALFLNLPSEDKRFLGTEWDEIEHLLQRPEIWGFISKDLSCEQGRIEYLFELYFYLSSKTLYGEYKRMSGYAPWIYDGLMDSFKQSAQPDDYAKLWNTIKGYARQIECFYADTQFYHYIGFLMCIGADMKEIFKLLQAAPSQQVQKAQLKGKIIKKFEKAEVDRNNWNELVYKNEDTNDSDNKKEIKWLLLLFNVLTCMTGKEKIYFPFDLYTKIDQEEEWSLEHIFAQHTKEDTSLKMKDRCEILQEQLSQLEENPLTKEEQETLKKLQKKQEGTISDFSVLQSLEEKISAKEEMHRICNLALLDKNTNSGLGNKLFREKSSYIKQVSQQKFIPPATKNVFLKFYSQKVENFCQWEKNDRKDYASALKTLLEDYLPASTLNQEKTDVANS